MANSNINLVNYKKYNSDTQLFDKYQEVENIDLHTFMVSISNLELLMEVHWSIDFLNPDFTTATVYIKF